MASISAPSRVGVPPRGGSQPTAVGRGKVGSGAGASGSEGGEALGTGLAKAETRDTHDTISTEPVIVSVQCTV